MDPRAAFGLSALMSFVSASIVAGLYLWPQLRQMDRSRALTALVMPHMFLRFLGLGFLVPGVVSPSLGSGFAIPAAYGDLGAGILAIVATVALLKHSAGANTAVWLFNIWGTLDLLFAFYRAGQIQLQPAALGPTFFMVTAIVPLLLVTHALVFLLLFRPVPVGSLVRSAS